MLRRCAWCGRELPRCDSTGEIQPAWLHDELEGVWCRACYWRWYYDEFGEEAVRVIRDLPVNPLAEEVVKALRIMGETDAPEIAVTEGGRLVGAVSRPYPN